MEHDLAKVGVAGSSPVSRSRENKKRISIWMSFSCFRALPGARRFEISIKQLDTPRILYNLNGYYNSQPKWMQKSVPEIPRTVILKCDGSAISANETGWRRSRRGCSSQRTYRSIRRLVQSPRHGTDIHTEPHGTATWCSRR